MSCCHSPADKILRLGHRSVKGVYGTDGVLIEDLSSGYGKFPMCKFCFEAVRRKYTMVNTNCDICGGSLLHPDEIKEGVHKRYEEWKKENIEVKKNGKG